MTRAIMRLRAFFLNLRHPAERDAEVTEELNATIDILAAERMARGESPAQARRAARLELGGVEQVQEEVRAVRAGSRVMTVVQDVRVALRGLARNPGYTAAVLATLGLGIGATTAIYTVVQAVLLRQLPYEEPERLVRMWPSSPSREIEQGGVSFPELADWSNLKTVFDGVAGYSTLPTGLALVGAGEPIRLETAYVSEDFFTTLGVRAQVGRTISPEEHRDGANRVVVISDALWRAQYGGDPRLVGRSVQLNDESFTVVGVMPREMRYPTSTVQAWTPLTVIPEQGIPRIRFARWINMVGRLRDGVTEQQANQGIRDLARRLSEEHADSNEGWTAAPVQSLRDSVLGASRERLLVMFGTGLLILLLGCVNIANLVLSRATQRTRELSVRAALGASRGRLVRQLLTESILLSLIGGVIGVALASWGAKALTALAGSWLPLPADVPLDARVLLFALGLSLATGIAFGLIPAAANRTHLGGALRESRGNTAGRGPQLTRAFFVVSEVALAMMLVLGALFFARSFAALNRVNPGFDTEHTAIARITLPDSRYPDAAAFLPAADRLLAAVRARPGVEAAALIKNAPLRGAGEPYGFDLPARNLPPDARPVANAIPVSPGYFDAMGIPLVAGRDFTSRDAELPVVIISSGLAARYWPDGNAVGQEIVVTDSPARIIGVAGDAKYESLTGDATPMIYLLPSNMTRRVITIVARSSSNPDALVESMRAAVHEVDPELPITEAIAMRDAVRDALGPQRFLMLLVGMFGVLALILAAVGVFGVVSYVVGQRTNEIGIRTALGARPLAIVRATVASSMIPVVVGIAGGAVAAYAGLRVVGAQLFSVNPADPVSYATVAAALLIISALAALVPAARAARVDPTTALRL